MPVTNETANANSRTSGVASGSRHTSAEWDQAHQPPHTRIREKQAGHAPRDSEQYTFGEELPGVHPRSRRSPASPPFRDDAPRLAPQQIRNVGTGDQQDYSHNDHQHVPAAVTKAIPQPRVEESIRIDKPRPIRGLSIPEYR